MSDTFEREVRELLVRVYYDGDSSVGGFAEAYADNNAKWIANELRAALLSSASSRCCDCGTAIMSELCDACRQNATAKEPTP